jgi:hypothetical protein
VKLYYVPPSLAANILYLLHWLKLYSVAPSLTDRTVLPTDLMKQQTHQRGRAFGGTCMTSSGMNYL